MANGIGTITEIRLEPDGLSGWIACPPVLRPNPGQYLIASSPDLCEPLPRILFPSAIQAEGIRVSAPLPVGWAAGMQLPLRGPYGHGFRMPHATRRLAVAAIDGSPARLLPLAHQALRMNASVVVYTHQSPSGLPAEVEVLPLDLLPEAPAWADFLALETPMAQIGDVRVRLGLKPYQRLACPAQVLVIAPMPCSGQADCGVCAIPTKDGWALTCTDGPVFDFNVLEGG